MDEYEKRIKPYDTEDVMDKALYNFAHNHLVTTPSAQPEMNFDEWCTDCKEYDQEKHCCPRFNRVIRNALKDAQPERERTMEVFMFGQDMGNPEDGSL